MTDVPNLLESAIGAKEAAWATGDEFIPVVQMGTGDEPKMFVMLRAGEEKDDLYAAITECLFVFCLQDKYDTFQFASDAHMSRWAEDEWDAETSPMPSQDPKAVDCLVITEYKDGAYRMYGKPYHISDSGDLVWEEAFDHDSGTEGYIPTMIEAAIESPPDGPPFSSDYVAGLFLENRGHTVMVPGDA